VRFFRPAANVSLTRVEYTQLTVHLQRQGLVRREDPVNKDVPARHGEALASAAFPPLLSILPLLGVSPIRPSTSIEKHRDDVQIYEGRSAFERVFREARVPEQRLDPVEPWGAKVISSAMGCGVSQPLQGGKRLCARGI